MRVYCLLACLLVASVLPGADVKRAEIRFKDAQKAERKGELVRAYLLYSEAAAFDPSNLQYWLRAKTLETRASAYGKKKSGVPPVLVGVPADAAMKNRKQEAEVAEAPEPVTEAELAEARQAQPPLKVKAGGGRLSFDFRGDARALFQQVARLYGLDSLAVRRLIDEWLEALEAGGFATNPLRSKPAPQLSLEDGSPERACSA